MLKQITYRLFLILALVCVRIEITKAAAQEKYLLIYCSASDNSFNKQLITYAANYLTQKKISNQVIGIAEYNQPPYNPEVARPEAINKLWREIAKARALIIACPEYNSSMPGFVKNTLDWLSLGSTSCFAQKPVLLITAEQSYLGLIELDKILAHLGAYTYPAKFHLTSDQRTLNVKKKILNLDLKQQQNLYKHLQNFNNFAVKVTNP